MTSSIHIVRRYGPVGGMERYVWELTHALADLGHPVTVLCEKTYDSPAPGINVIELGTSIQKPRWVSMLCFSKKISRWVRKHAADHDCIIHSHERTSVHHVTTFHGPPILDRKSSWTDVFSPRLAVWRFLEKRELESPNVLAILPNSTLISDQLVHFYPGVKSKIRPPAYPGVSPEFFKVSRKSGAKTIGFIGKEWKRKGLDLAVDYLTELFTQNSDLHFLIAGPAPEEIEHLFQNWSSSQYTLAGWMQTELFLESIDILIHPARKEPFGMVIAEANAAGIPCIISESCGIASLITPQMGDILPIDAPISSWAKKVEARINTGPSPIDKLNLTWAHLAEQHIALYSSLVPRNS